MINIVFGAEASYRKRSVGLGGCGLVPQGTQQEKCGHHSAFLQADKENSYPSSL